jgi:prephenate dehydratase
MSAKSGNREEAQTWFRVFERNVAGAPFQTETAELRLVLSLMDRPAELAAHLDAIKEAKLSSLEGRPLG